MSHEVSLTVPSLSQGVGYGVIIGLGAFFALVVVGISQSLRKFSGVQQSSSEYAVASRSLGTGLVACAVTSAWCWSVTLLSSVATAYNYGLAGAFIYGAGNMSQISLFSLVAIQMKRKVPTLNTHLQLMRLRYGVAGHATFLFFALATNILVVSSVLVGAAATIESLTGANVYAMLFLLPLAVLAYTLRGGLRATILGDYLHTIIIFCILFALFFTAYATSSDIGSPGRMYELLQSAADRTPSDNYAGSWVTMKSRGAIAFGWLSFLEYSGVVLSDASFFQKGIAANPNSAVPGYILGSLAWFSIPWALATTAGLTALALQGTSSAFPALTTEQVSAGLVLPYAAQALLGVGGSVAVLLLMFLSSTSAISSQLIAVSSIAGYDIFKTYRKPSATADEVLKVQMYTSAGFSFFMAAFGCLLHGVGVDLGLLYNITGVWSTAAMPQMLFTFFTTRLPRWCAFPGIWISFFAGLAAWLGLAARLGGAVTIANLSDMYVCLYTFTTSIATGILLCTIGVIFTPSDFQWSQVAEAHAPGEDEDDVAAIAKDARYAAPNLKKWLLISAVASGVIFAVFMLIWPLSLYRDYVFTESFFSGWVSVSVAWAFVAFGIVGFIPLWEGRFLFKSIGLGIAARVKGQSTPPSGERAHPSTLARDSAGSSPPGSPIEAEKSSGRSV